MESFKADLSAIWVVIHEAILRFWQNRFIKSDEVRYLRGEINKRDEEIKRLTNIIAYFADPIVESPQPIIAQQEAKPFGGYTPFHIVRQKAERESFERAKRLSEEAKNELAAERKSTEDLEKELLG